MTISSASMDRVIGPKPANTSKCYFGKNHRFKFTPVPHCVVCKKTGREIAELRRLWLQNVYHWKKRRNAERGQITPV